jgi:hypothetical protein
MLRVVTWNMDHWRRSHDLREQAWTFLERTLHPDVALVQEALPVGRGRSVVFREGGIRDDRVTPCRDLGWGSAVVSYAAALAAIESATGPFSSKPVDLLRTLPGSVAIADVTEHSLVVISAYGIIDHGYAESTVHRILSDLTPLIDMRRGKGIILAGDLNITTQWSAKHRSFTRGFYAEWLRRDRNLFERFEALGLRNVVVRPNDNTLKGCECEAGSECRHIQTQRHERSPFPWQNDYVFVTEDLIAQPHTLEVCDHDDAWLLSSHCPIVVEFPSI